MIPVLYESTETAFTTNGIGRLADAISCKVTEERNGAFDLEMVYPVTGQHYKDLDKLKLIYAVPAAGKAPQPFEIYRISAPISGRVAIYAHHISYRLNKTATMGVNVTASTQACSQALQGLITGAILPQGQSFGFTFWTDVVTGASYKQDVPASVKSRLLGTEGSILDQFGGEFEWDKFAVKLWAERGSDKGVTIRYGKNLTDLTQEFNIDNTVTGCIPYWKGEDETVTGGINYSAYHAQYSHERIVAVDFTDQFENKPTAEALNNLGQIYANEHGKPTVSIEVSFVDLAQTEEYKDMIPLQSVNLCDIVTVQYEALGINETAKISKTVYDVLLDRYESVTVGDITPSLAQTITSGVEHDIEAVSTNLTNKLKKTKEEITDEYTEAIANATRWLTSSGGYVIAIKDEQGTWKELVFASSKNLEANNTKILRINNNGIGFSSTGINGPYTNAWTIDGHLVADFIHGGTLTLGGNGNNNGWLKIVNASGEVIGRWDKDGIYASNGTFTGTINATSGSLSNVRVDSLTLGNTTWSGSALDDRLAYILSVAQTANNAASAAASAAAQAQATADKIAAGIDVSWFPQKGGKAYLKNIRVEELEVEEQIEVYDDDRGKWHTGDDGVHFTIDGDTYQFHHGILWEH